MQKPPLSLLFSGIFFGYIIYSLYSLSQLFVPPACKTEDTCLKSFLRNNPKLELYLFSSPSGRPSPHEVSPVFSISPFNYSSTFEMYAHFFHSLIKRKLLISRQICNLFFTIFFTRLFPGPLL